MSKTHLQTTVAYFKAQLLRIEGQVERALTMAHGHTLSMIQPQLDRLYQQIADKEQTGESIPLSWLFQQGSLQALQRTIDHQVDRYAELAKLQAAQLQHQGVVLGTQSAHALLKSALPAHVPWSFGIPSPKAIQNIIGSTQAGTPLVTLFNGFGKEAASKATQSLKTGVTLGYGPRKLAVDLQSALGISRNRALVISRQELLRSYRSAALETYQANSDVASGWTWQCSYSDQTCVVCLSMDGSEHDLSEDFDSHISCRCVPVPITKSWSDLFPGIENLPDESEDDSQNGEEWFDDQDESTQRAIFPSSAAYDLYASGDATLQDFVGVRHDATWGTSRYVKSAQEVMDENDDE